MKTWMAVEANKLELPVAVAATGTELARLLKTSNKNIYSKKEKEKSGKICGYKVVVVDTE